MSRYSNRTLGHKRKQIHDPEELEKKLGDGEPGAGVDALGGGGGGSFGRSKNDARRCAKRKQLQLTCYIARYRRNIRMKGCERSAEKAYALCEKFRPEIPSGKKGWGASGKLDLDLIHKIASA